MRGVDVFFLMCAASVVGRLDVGLHFVSLGNTTRIDGSRIRGILIPNTGPYKVVGLYVVQERCAADFEAPKWYKGRLGLPSA